MNYDCRPSQWIFSPLFCSANKGTSYILHLSCTFHKFVLGQIPEPCTYHSLCGFTLSLSSSLFNLLPRSLYLFHLHSYTETLISNSCIWFNLKLLHYYTCAPHFPCILWHTLLSRLKTIKKVIFQISTLSFSHAVQGVCKFLFQ